MSNVPTTGMSVEVWECRACGKDAPCRVEITHRTTKYPHVEAQPRFTTRNRGCLCDERLDPAWARLPNAALTGGVAVPSNGVVGG